MSDKDAATPRVYLIRHGETEWSRNGRYTGISDLPLLPDGESRVRQTKSVIVGPGRLVNPTNVLKVYCSPRQRATKTLEILFEDSSRPPSDVSITEEIAEWHYADYEGLKTHEIIELRKSRGHDKDKKWDIWRDGTEGPGSESPNDVTLRLDKIIAEIGEQHAKYLSDAKSENLEQWNGKRDILVIAHGHILRAFVKRWLGVPLDTKLELMLEPGGVCGLSYAHGNVNERAVLCDELEAVNSIYDPGVLTTSDTAAPPSSNTSTTSIILTLPDLPFSFLLLFPPDYPDVPPTITGTQSTGANTKKGDGENATNILRDVLGRIFIPDQVCLFDLIEETIPLLQAIHQEETTHVSGGVEGIHHGSSEDPRHIEDRSKRSAELPSDASTTVNDKHSLTFESANAAMTPSIPPPNWILSESLVVNKSTFIARALRISSLSQATQSISHLLSTNKKVAGATHNITAWRIKQILTGDNDNKKSTSSSTPTSTNTNTDTVSTSTNPEIVIQDCDDDGETAAGGRLLHLMQLMDVWNVVVVVTRWYGGVKLGPDRFRLINQVAREALVNGGFVSKEEEGQKGKGKGRKK